MLQVADGMIFVLENDVYLVIQIRLLNGQRLHQASFPGLSNYHIRKSYMVKGRGYYMSVHRTVISNEMRLCRVTKQANQ